MKPKKSCRIGNGQGSMCFQKKRKESEKQEGRNADKGKEKLDKWGRKWKLKGVGHERQARRKKERRNVDRDGRRMANENEWKNVTKIDHHLMEQYDLEIVIVTYKTTKNTWKMRRREGACKKCNLANYLWLVQAAQGRQLDKAWPRPRSTVRWAYCLHKNKWMVDWRREGDERQDGRRSERQIKKYIYPQ